jgi:hypothetical protein
MSHGAHTDPSPAGNGPEPLAPSPGSAHGKALETFAILADFYQEATRRYLAELEREEKSKTPSAPNDKS